MRIAAGIALALALAAFVPVPSAAQLPEPSAPAGAARSFSPQQLDELLAPIALYPDALLAQVLMAATYPLEIVEAARWSKANPGLKDQALEDAMQSQSWDPSVKALTAVPQVLAMMSDKLDWTQKLGDAFLAQQEDVMTTAQNLRGKAQAAGNLQSTPEQVVKTEVIEQKTVYVIESAKPEVVYVPVYDPGWAYGPWWYPVRPPYYWYPPGYVSRPGFWFGTGVIVGAAIWGHVRWRERDVNININYYNRFNRTNITVNRFEHRREHRRGVAYRDAAVASKYNRGGDRRAIEARERFRGRAETGRQELQRMDRDALRDRVGAAGRPTRDIARPGAGDRPTRDFNRPGATDRPTRDFNRPGAGDRPTRDFNRPGTGDRPTRDIPRPSPSTREARGDPRGGFQGFGSGSQARAYSARGSSSRAAMPSRPAPRPMARPSPRGR